MNPSEHLRQAYPEALARVMRQGRGLSHAEDALHSAVVRALETWPERGVPDNPVGWLVASANHKVIDIHRAQSRADAAVPELLAARGAEGRLPHIHEGWRDDALRLVVTCCDPVLAIDAQVALTLATVGGLSTRELAQAFLVEARTMEQRLVRARRRLSERATGETPRVDVITERLPAVLGVIHALHGEGAWASGEMPIRRDLCRFARQLCHALTVAAPEAPEARGMLALLELHAGRMPARVVDGAYISLELQDRTRWDAAALTRGRAALDLALTRRNPGPYQIEAAIAAVHCEASAAEATDWPQIALLYEALERHRPNPSVTVNRAFALGMASGATAGLAVLESVVHDPRVARSPYIHLVRGVLLARAGQVADARTALEQARSKARNPEERAQIEARMEALDAPNGPGE